MSHDVLAQLNGLRDHVRARIEATTDYKALMSVEKAIGEVQSLLPVAAQAAEAPVAAAAAEEVIAEATTEASHAVAEADADAPAAEAPAAEALAAEALAEAETCAGTSEVTAEAVADEAAAETTAEAAGDEAAAEATVEAPAETATDDVKVAEIPAEDRPLVAELVAAAAELPASAASTTK